MLIHGAMLLMPGEKRSQVKKSQNNSVKKVDKISYTPYKFLAPTIAAMLLLMGYPLVNNVWLAFQRKNLCMSFFKRRPHMLHSGQSLSSFLDFFTTLFYYVIVFTISRRVKPFGRRVFGWQSLNSLQL